MVSSTDFPGKPFVVYFYPKDDTPGCTTEACQFTDNISQFEFLGVPVLGISQDDAASHRAFADKYRLRVRLLSDPDRKVHEAYGAWGERRTLVQPNEPPGLAVRVACVLPDLLREPADQLLDGGVVELRTVRADRAELGLEHVAHVHHDVPALEGLEEERLRFVRLESLVLPELGEHLARRRVRIDRPEHDLAGRDVIRMVHVEVAGVARCRVHREDRVRAMDADLAGDVLPHLKRRVEVAVLMTQEDHVLHAKDPRGLALLGETDVAQLLARHGLVLRSGRAVGDHAVGHLDTGFRPLRDRSCHAELGVVGMGVHDERALDLEPVVELHAAAKSRASSSAPSTRRGPGRLKNALPSTGWTRPARTAGTSSHPGSLRRRWPSLAARRSSKPHGMSTSTSGDAATTSAHAISRERSPGDPSTSVPPAISTCSGTQWPPLKSGSSHSRQATRGRERPALRVRTASRRARSDATSSSAARARPIALPTRPTSSSMPSSELASRGTTGARSALGTWSSVIAQTAQSV